MRAREPIKGLRQKLRNAIRTAGITGKFSTDLRRTIEGEVLVVQHNDTLFNEELITVLEGTKVVYRKRNEK